MKLAQDILDASILVVDDQEAPTRHLTGLLVAAGYTRVAATTAPAEVCALHRRHEHDVILLDLQMQSVDGFSLISALKVQHPEGELPVIALTAEPEQRLRALRAGVRDYIGKPLDEMEVKARIRNVLEARVLHRKLQNHLRDLERQVSERTAELRESETRFRSLVELASDWYWEQDEHGAFTRVSGPVIEMLGLNVGPGTESSTPDEEGWDLAERRTLRAYIAARRPFLDFSFHRVLHDGTRQHFRASGQPIFDNTCRYIGYRGVGVEVTPGR